MWMGNLGAERKGKVADAATLGGLRLRGSEDGGDARAAASRSPDPGSAIRVSSPHHPTDGAPPHHRIAVAPARRHPFRLPAPLRRLPCPPSPIRRRAHFPRRPARPLRPPRYVSILAMPPAFRIKRALIFVRCSIFPAVDFLEYPPSAIAAAALVRAAEEIADSSAGHIGDLTLRLGAWISKVSNIL